MDSKTPRNGTFCMRSSSRGFFYGEECCSALQLPEIMREHWLHRDDDKWKRWQNLHAKVFSPYQHLQFHFRSFPFEHTTTSKLRGACCTRISQDEKWTGTSHHWNHVSDHVSDGSVLVYWYSITPTYEQIYIYMNDVLFIQNIFMFCIYVNTV